MKGGGKEGLHTLCCDENGVCYSFGTSHKGQLGTCQTFQVKKLKNTNVFFLGNCAEKWGFHIKDSCCELSPYKIGSEPKDIKVKQTNNRK